MLATEKPIINQCKARASALCLLCTELGYILLPPLLCVVDCMGSFPVLQEDFEMKLLPCFRS